MIAPIPPVPLIEGPVAHDPPVLGDITNLSIHRHRVMKRKIEEIDSIDSDEIARVVVAEHKLVQQVAGDQVAPPWFAAAINAALAPILQRLDRLETKLDRLETKMDNSCSFEDGDVIVGPHNGEQNPPDFAPSTILQLKQLSGHQLTGMENYYHLNHAGRLEERRRRVALKYGVRFVSRVVSTATISSI